VNWKSVIRYRTGESGIGEPRMDEFGMDESETGESGIGKQKKLMPLTNWEFVNKIMVIG